MIEITQLNNCCSVLELGCFDGARDWNNMEKSIIDDLKTYYEEWIWDGDDEYPTVLIATTIEKQTDAAEALKALGFRSRKVCGRHATSAKDKYLTFWIRTSLPKELTKFIKDTIEEIRKEKEA